MILLYYFSQIINYLPENCRNKQDVFPSICFNITKDIENICKQQKSFTIDHHQYCNIFRGEIY